MRIINWIKYHEYEHNKCNDCKKESSALVDMGSRMDKEERTSIPVNPS